MFPVPEWLARRWALLRMFRVVPRRTIWLLAIVLIAAASTTPLMAASAGWLVARTLEVTRGREAMILLPPLAVIGIMMIFQLVSDVLIFPVRERSAQLVDGSVRQRVRLALASRPGVDHLENPIFRDLAGHPLSEWESIGYALEGQLAVIARYAAALGSALLVARVSVPVAVLVFALLVAKRLYLRTIYAPFLSDVGRSIQPDLRTAEYWHNVGSSIAGGKELRVFGFSDYVVANYHDKASARVRIYERTFRRAASAAWPAWIIEAVAVGLPFLILSQQALSGGVSFEHIAIALGATLGMLDIGGVGNETYIVEAATNNVAALEELERVLAEQRPELAKQFRVHSSKPPTIDFLDVSFSYPGSARPVFQSLNLRLAPGQSVAIVGENGVGKSTLVKLLCRFYEPTSGQILADGQDITELDVDEWRSRLAVVFQEFKRLHLSARDNISLADPFHPMRDAFVEQAVEAAGAQEVVGSLPLGLDTILSRGYTGGADLSGGQWQRIALARALYGSLVGAQILVLDEPTAHLDVGAEIAIFDQLLTHAAGKTAVVISHRYSTVRRADRIVVLGPEGSVIEDGTHAELLTKGGTYARLFNLQAGAFISGIEQ